MILPSGKLLLILLLPTVPLVAFPGLLMMGITAGFDVAVLVVAGIDVLLSAKPSQLIISRTRPGQLSLDEPGRLGWRIDNRSSLHVPVRLIDEVPPELNASELPVEATIAARSKAELSYGVHPTQRGRFTLGAIHVRWRTALGLAIRQRKIASATLIDVYPNVANLGRYELAAQRQRRQSLGLKPARLPGQGSLFESLRDYHEGDELTQVAWKATARRGRLISRNYQIDQSQNILLMLDCGRLMTTEIEGLSRLDYAVNAALMLGYVAVQQGDYVGMMGFGEKIERYMPATRGRRALSMLKESLYTLQPELREAGYERACQFLALRHRKRSLIVLFTDVLDRDASAGLLAHLAQFARRHLPLCVTLRDLEVEQCAAAMPEDETGAFEKAVAAQMLERRQVALQSMRSFGVDVLDVDPRQMTPSVVQRYLELKHRRRI